MGVPGDLRALAATGILSAPTDWPAPEPTPTFRPARSRATCRWARSSPARMGREVTDRLVEPLLGGVYAGHADRLSLRATIPQLAALAAAGTSLSEGVRELLAAGAAAASTGRTAGPGVRRAARRRRPAGRGGGGGERGGRRRDPVTAPRSGRWSRLRKRRPEPDRPDGWSRTRTADSGCSPSLTARRWPPTRSCSPVPGVRRGPAARHRGRASCERPGRHRVRLGRHRHPRCAPGRARSIRCGTARFRVPGPARRRPGDQGWPPSPAPSGPWLAPQRRRPGDSARLPRPEASETAELDRDDTDLVKLVQADLADAVGLQAAPAGTHVQRWNDSLPQYAVGHLAPGRPDPGRAAGRHRGGRRGLRRGGHPGLRRLRAHRR